MKRYYKEHYKQRSNIQQCIYGYIIYFNNEQQYKQYNNNK